MSRCVISRPSTPIISLIISNKCLGTDVVNQEAVNYRIATITAIVNIISDLARINVREHHEDCLGTSRDSLDVWRVLCVLCVRCEVPHIVQYGLYRENKGHWLFLPSPLVLR